MRIIHCSEMATNKGKSSRGRSCVAGGPNGESCKNTQYTQDVSIHTFPNRSSQPSRHMQWVKYVRRHRPGWQASQSSILCSVHFDESSFTMRQDLARELGIKAILKPDAVPSIDVANNAEVLKSLRLSIKSFSTNHQGWKMIFLQEKENRNKSGKCILPDKYQG